MAKNAQYISGLVAAKVAIAEIMGAVPMSNLTEDVWQLHNRINHRLNEMLTLALSEEPTTVSGGKRGG